MANVKVKRSLDRNRPETNQSEPYRDLCDNDNLLTTALFSSSVIPPVVPTSTSAAVEMVVNGAEEPPNLVTPVAVRTDNAQNSTNPTKDIQASPHSDPHAQETTTSAIDSASTSITNLDSVLTSVTVNPAQTPSLAQLGPTLDFIGFIQVQQPTERANVSDSGVTSGDSADQSMDYVQKPTGSATGSDLDVNMADDTGLPTYLTKMIGYLRGVAVDWEWQDLVTNFIAFEKTGHPVNGVCTM